MFTEEMTLREFLSQKVLAPIAPYAVSHIDLSAMPEYEMTLAALRQRHFGGDIAHGCARLLRAAESGDWFYPLYDAAECAVDPEKKDANLLRFPSDDPAADGRPYLLILPGGGFSAVWNLSEGWPIADHVNTAGYHAFVLTYRVACRERIAEKEMEDVARAVALIRDNAAHFHVQWDRYVPCGFSAGGYLTALWCAGRHGYLRYGLPKPFAAVPVYPYVSPTLGDAEGTDGIEQLLGCKLEDAYACGLEPQEDAANFPPTAIFVSSADELVPAGHSRLLQRKLAAAGVPVYLEEKEGGHHGFAGGEGMNMEGWPFRMLHWLESL